VIFDYYGPNDFKFAGIDQSRNKIQLGRRTVAGWIVDVEANLRSFPDTYYHLLVAVNGTHVTVVVDGQHAFSHTFAPRIVGGHSYALNTGMVGVGSNNARGYYGDFVVQVLPPQITLDEAEDFTDPSGLLAGPEEGIWTHADGRYAVPPANGEAAVKVSTSDWRRDWPTTPTSSCRPRCRPPGWPAWCSIATATPTSSSPGSTSPASGSSPDTGHHAAGSPSPRRHRGTCLRA
jgi:hypothetical protein